MSLISLKDIKLGFGGPPLLDGLSLSLDRGERVCLLGRNGVGKSTLMKVISGEITPDAGERSLQKGVRIARLVQEVPAGITGTVFEVVSQGLGEAGDLVRAYHAASSRLHPVSDSKGLASLARIQTELEAAGGWLTEQQVEEIVTRLKLPPDAQFEVLSGGVRRRALLVQALVSEADLLLLDEPTNQLDISSITWLEEYLARYDGAVLFVTHDRSFLQRLATRILELDRGWLADWPGDYANYLRRREDFLNAEARESERFQRRLAQEETWIRKGIKARRTRNEGRVRALEAMREERRHRREVPGTVNLQLDAGRKSGKLVARVEDISFSWRGTPIVEGFSTTILRGDRIGIVGANGVGKTTLIRLLLGLLPPASGSVQLGTNLDVAYYDQMRLQLDDEKTVADNVADGRDQLRIGGRNRHIVGYLEEFLFTPEQARMKARTLSGGERNRLLLARLFARPANVLVMDEPTNDLDLETLEVLEELLLEYSGTLLLVSHDRTFLNNTVTSAYVFEVPGKVVEYVGGYDDWESLTQPEMREASTEAVAKPKLKPALPATSRRLTYRENLELEALPGRIEALEAERETLQSEMQSPELYQERAESVSHLTLRWRQLESELELLYGRWEELESRQDSPSG